MGAPFHDFTFIQNKDLLGVFNRLQPLGDNKCRASLHQFTKRLLNQEFRFRIDTGS